MFNLKTQMRDLELSDDKNILFHFSLSNDALIQI